MGKTVLMVVLLGGLLWGCAPSREELLNTGISEFQAGRNEAAKVTFHRTLQYYPGDPEAYYALGRIWHQEGNLPQAIFYYRSCLDAAPWHDRARIWLERAVVDAKSEPDAFNYNY